MKRHLLSDGDLVAAARAGDASALALLLERHRPRLLATALRLLGHGPDAEDAVQETCLVALRHLGTLRDPAAVTAWLQAVLRRACLQQQRRQRRESPVADLPDVASDGAGPEERLERLELRDWIWSALQALPEPLRITTLLRYFGSYDSYDELAAILGIPIGTVRSRLAQARLALTRQLLASGRLLADPAQAAARERARFWTDALQDIFRHGSSTGFVAHFPRDLVIARSGAGTVLGREHLAAEIEDDLSAGVRLEPERALAGAGVTVIEARFHNPPEAPEHCPPGLALVLLGPGEAPARLHLHLAARPPRPPLE